MRVAVVTFPGSNCDDDCVHVAGTVCGQDAYKVFHTETDLGAPDVVLLPGGFSYGDYLRCGAIARFSPIMESVRAFAEKGGPILGICNGFQILTEAGLLPGALRRNAELKFLCEDVWLRIEGRETPFTRGLAGGGPRRIPIAHHDGNYLADPELLRRLEGEGQIVFRYCDADGQLTDAANPNGSMGHVAGVCNASGNVVGMMPHPERLSESVLGGTDGRALFDVAFGRAA